MNLIQTRVTDFETGERNIRITLDIHAFVLNGVDKQVEEHAPESIVVEMPLRCAETFHLGQTICFTDPSLVREVEEITVRASAYNRDVMVPGKRTVTKTFPPAEVSREPGQPRPWEKRHDTELALLRTRLEAATSRADSRAVEVQQLEELRKREAAAYEKRLAERDQEVHDLVDQRNVVQRQMGDLNEALVRRIADLERRLVQLSTATSTVDAIQSRSPLQATPALVGDTAQKCMDDLSDALNELKAVREALQAPDADLTVDVAERRMTSILDLRAKVDVQDREIAQALSGLFHGDNAVVAVQKLAAHYRSTSVLEKKE